MKRLASAVGLLLLSAAPAFAGRTVVTTPEPATFALVLGGLAIVGGSALVNRRRK